MNRKNDMPLGCAILYLAFVLFLLVGWVKNGIALFHCNFKAPYKAEVIRTIGVFVAPIGSVAGFADIED